MTAITIDTTGCLKIPLEIRQQLEITIAQSLSLEVVNGCIILQPLREPQVRRQGTALVVETSPLGNLDSLIDHTRMMTIDRTCRLFIIHCSSIEPITS
jgi:bifunctional DNA-binding transcriptional regulator/antitoxin component of YhaV-PrlF toxin-antitoxin module